MRSPNSVTLWTSVWHMEVDILVKVETYSSIHRLEAINSSMGYAYKSGGWRLEGMLIRLNSTIPCALFVHWYSKWRMVSCISKYLDQCLKSFQDMSGTKSVIVALASYRSDNDSKRLDGGTDATSRVSHRVKLIIPFSGHDTTSRSVCYLFYALANNTTARTRMRAEHN